jgi:hypothetical protein
MTYGRSAALVPAHASRCLLLLSAWEVSDTTVSTRAVDLEFIADRIDGQMTGYEVPGGRQRGAARRR